MDLIERIKKNFNKGFFNKAMSIDGISTDYPAWTLKQDDWVGVAVPLSDAVSFSESFIISLRHLFILCIRKRKSALTFKCLMMQS